MFFTQWLENLMLRGLGFAISRYYSVYRGIVTDNKDPKNLGRVKILCVQAGQTAAPDRWVLPATAGGGNKRGMFFTPEVDDAVWVSFYEGDPNLPEVYWGGWYGQVDGSTPDVPDGLAPKGGGYPEKKGWTTRAGHSLIFNDEDGKESITILWNRPAAGDAAKTDRTKTAAVNPDETALLTFDPTGSFSVKTPSSYLLQIQEPSDTDKAAGKQGEVKIVTPNGSMFFISNKDAINLIHKSGASLSLNDKSIDISANTSTQMNVNVSGQNINLNGGGVLLGSKAIDFAVMGLKLILWLAKHTHGTGVGPTTPPLIPPTPADFLSKTIKVQE